LSRYTPSCLVHVMTLEFHEGSKTCSPPDAKRQARRVTPARAPVRDRNRVGEDCGAPDLVQPLRAASIRRCWTFSRVSAARVIIDAFEHSLRGHPTPQAAALWLASGRRDHRKIHIISSYGAKRKRRQSASQPMGYPLCAGSTCWFAVRAARRTPAQGRDRPSRPTGPSPWPAAK
jgi:hypothetical protein